MLTPPFAVVDEHIVDKNGRIVAVLAEGVNADEVRSNLGRDNWDAGGVDLTTLLRLMRLLRKEWNRQASLRDERDFAML